MRSEGAACRESLFAGGPGLLPGPGSTRDCRGMGRARGVARRACLARVPPRRYPPSPLFLQPRAYEDQLKYETPAALCIASGVRR